MGTMGTKRRLLKLAAHPALLILVLGAVYAFTIGRNPQGGPTLEDLALDATTMSIDLPGQADLDVDMPRVATMDPAAIDELAEAAVQAVATAEHASANGALSANALVDAVTPAGVGGPTEAEANAQGPIKPTVYTHTVLAGETLSDIARLYNVDIDTIIAANAIPDPNRIRSGDKLTVPSVKGVLHTVQRGESLWTISSYYEVAMDEIIAANAITNPNTLRVGQELVIPGGQAIVAMRQKEAIVSASGKLLRNFSWPVTGRISSRFGERWGRMHYGLDIAVPTGTPVRAAAAGRVTFSGMQGGYGYLIKIDHGNGVETRYAHNSRLVAKVGQTVKRGDIIAYSGNTGNSTGPHVHFEIRRNGVALDPLDFLR